MSKETNQPDWDKIAEKFDIWLPAIQPVGDALLEALDVRAGDNVLDVASGTGEPALSLARQMGDDVSITGVDAADGMVNVAQSKVEKEGLNSIRFRCMPAEKLDFEDNHFDRVLCRFGVMLFEDSQTGLNEMQRVLKPGGRAAIAVWSTPETMPTLCWAYEVFKHRIPEDEYPPLIKVTSLSGVGVLDEMLDKAGFSQYTIENHSFNYEFASFDAYWQAVEDSDILKQQYEALPEAERGAIRDEVARFAKDFISDRGLVIPHEYLLAVATK